MQNPVLHHPKREDSPLTWEMIAAALCISEGKTKRVSHTRVRQIHDRAIRKLKLGLEKDPYVKDYINTKGLTI